MKSILKKRLVFELVIYSFHPAKPSEWRTFECASESEAQQITDMLLKGRPYYSLKQIATVERRTAK